MGRHAILLLLMLSLACGCAQPREHAADPHRTRWEYLCAHLRSPSRAGPDPSSASLDPAQQAALVRVARSSAAAVVHIRTVHPRISDPQDPAAAPRCASRHSGGTGVVIRPRGLILTAAHVVRGATSVSVVTPDGEALPVVRVVLDERLDLAMLRVAARRMSGLALDFPAARVGTAVAAMGSVSPQRTVLHRVGVITDLHASLQRELDPLRACDYGELIESSAVPEPGFSGGPLLDASGRLVGVNVAVAGGDGARRGYALPLTGAVRETVLRLAREAAR